MSDPTMKNTFVERLNYRELNPPVFAPDDNSNNFTTYRAVGMQMIKAAQQAIPTGPINNPITGYDTLTDLTSASANPVTGVWTCPVEGLWTFTGSGAYAGNTTGNRMLRFLHTRADGSFRYRGQQSDYAPQVSQGQLMSTSATFVCRVGDTVVLDTFQTSGVDLNFNDITFSCAFHGITGATGTSTPGTSL